MKNNFSQEIFEAVYEKSPWIVHQTWTRCQNLDNYEIIKLELKKTIEIATKEEKLSLLQSHPELASKLAVQGKLTKESNKEQKSAGLSNCSPDQYQKFNELNTLYRNKFNFPFILAVTGLNIDTILKIFIKRLDNDYISEFNEAIKQVNKIAEIRINEIINNRGK
tara:strand:- start:659 stop:1153 length:495 start_codon:yes stop_codon:yes gene_type:complete